MRARSPVRADCFQTSGAHATTDTAGWHDLNDVDAMSRYGSVAGQRAHDTHLLVGFLPCPTTIHGGAPIPAIATAFGTVIRSMLAMSSSIMWTSRAAQN